MKELLKPLIEYKPDGGIRDYQNTRVVRLKLWKYLEIIESIVLTTLQ
jgi:hypothetical protein